MQRFFGTVILAAGLLALALEGVAVAAPLLRAPWSLHAWWPVPVACAGLRCVTYRQLADFARREVGEVSPAELLTRLLTREAQRTVARRTGLAVSEEELGEALESVERASGEDVRFRSFLELTYGNTRSEGFRENFRDLILARKLAAVGVRDVWASPRAPAVKVLHARYVWSARERQIVPRTYP